MTEPELKQLLTTITPPSETARAAAHAHWASLAKPLGGLGALETLLEDAAALTGTAQLAFDRACPAAWPGWPSGRGAAHGLAKWGDGSEKLLSSGFGHGVCSFW